jgi:hypothetical protein
MKRTMNRFKKNESGQALIMVLCFLALGALTVATVLNFMTTGIKASRVYEESSKLHYAADAGMENVLWMLHNEETPFELGDYTTEVNYTLPENINGKEVNVTMKQIWPLTGLESDAYGITIPNALTITGGISDQVTGKYKIQISYINPQVALPIDKVAVWLPTRFQYVPDSSSGITTQNPTITNQRGGKVLTWTFNNVDFEDLPNPPPSGGGLVPGEQSPATRTMYFNVTPLADFAGGSYCWVRTTDTSLYLAWETGSTIVQVTSTATDPDTGKSAVLGGYTYFSKGAALGEGGIQVRGNYSATGNTVMRSSKTSPTEGYKVRDILDTESSASITNIPEDAEVVLAYLYWSAWRDYETVGVKEADTNVGLKINGTYVYFDDLGHAVQGEPPEPAIRTLRPNLDGDTSQLSRTPGSDSHYTYINEENADNSTCVYAISGDTEVIILRPNGAGDFTQCSRSGSESNYQHVDESIADDASTYVYTTTSGGKTDTYQLPNLGSCIINSVKIYTRASASGSHSQRIQIVGRTNGSNFYDPPVTPTTLPSGGGWNNNSQTWTTNPVTGLAWTWQEIDALQIGIKLYDDGSGRPECTQIYAEISYTTPIGAPKMDTYQIPNLGQVFGTINGVTVYARTSANGTGSNMKMQITCRTNSTDYFGTLTTMTGNDGYHDYSETWTTNPYTGQAWKWEEIDALQIGISLFGDGIDKRAQCTQLYAEISYEVPYQYIQASKSWLLDNDPPDYAYSCFKDVTDLVKLISPQGNATYTVAGVSGNATTELAYGGWSLIIIYSSLSEQSHQFFLYDTFSYVNTNTSYTFTITGFEAPLVPDAALTAFAGEGDEWYGGTLMTRDYMKLNNSYLSDNISPMYNIWNGKSSRLGGQVISGIDIDGFNISNYIPARATSATVEIGSEFDKWNLIYIILTFSSQYGGLTPNATGIISYSYGGQ